MNKMDEWRQKTEKKRRQISSKNAVKKDNQVHVLAQIKTGLEEILLRGEDSSKL